MPRLEGGLTEKIELQTASEVCHRKHKQPDQSGTAGEVRFHFNPVIPDGRAAYGYPVDRIFAIVSGIDKAG